MPGTTLWIFPLIDAFPEIAVASISAAVGGVLVWFGTFLQHRLTVQRDDRQREAEARASRIQMEREIIGELIAEMYQWANAVANLGVTYEQARRTRSSAAVDVERFRKHQDDLRPFAAALARARVSVQNPAARPALEALRKQHLAMSTLLNQEAAGSPAPDYLEQFRRFQQVLGEVNQQLEEAALRWDGVLPPRSPEPAAG